RFGVWGEGGGRAEGFTVCGEGGGRAERFTVWVGGGGAPNRFQGGEGGEGRMGRKNLSGVRKGIERRMKKACQTADFWYAPMFSVM
ncbi:MAG: hypothetical protein FWD61_19875, partial [Phycisphaerales bacterium]|nr:hypothetical protein [Phycisphaerales bacterium]